MDQLIYASLSHTHYWYEVGMLKVPASAGGERRRWYCQELRTSTDGVHIAFKAPSHSLYNSRHAKQGMWARLGRATLTDGSGARHIMDNGIDGVPVTPTLCVTSSTFFFSAECTSKIYYSGH